MDTIKATNRPRYYIATVGTSLLSNFLKDLKNKAGFTLESIEELSCTSHDDCLVKTFYSKAYDSIRNKLQNVAFEEFRDCSAELSSLYKCAEKDLPGTVKGDKVILIPTSTPPGFLCSHLLKDALTNSEAINTMKAAFDENYVKIKECKYLGKANDATFPKKGIPEFVGLLSKLIRDNCKDYDIILVPTGGYKSIIPYAILVGMLFRKEIKEIRYIYEDSDKLLLLPSLPLGINFPDWHRHAFRISLVLFGSKESSEKAYHELKEKNQEISSLLEKSDDGHYHFNPFGNILWDEYQKISHHSISTPQHYLTERWAQNPILAERTLKFMEDWENIWEGMLLPQIVSHSQTHCHNLIRLAEELLSPILKEDSNFMRPIDLYVLMASLWLHDIGHNEHYRYKEDGLEFLSLEGIRKNHAELTYQRIERLSKELGFVHTFEDDEEAQLIATICKVHRGPEQIVSNMEELRKFASIELKFGDMEYKVNNPVFVACMLCLIDTCDIGVTRVGNSRFCNARMKANHEEMEAIKEHLKQLAPKENEYRSLLEGNLDFLNGSDFHFKKHAMIALVNFSQLVKKDNTWHVMIKVHPTKEVKNRDSSFNAVELVKQPKPWHLEKDLLLLNQLISQECSKKLHIELDSQEGDPISEDEATLNIQPSRM